MAGAMTTGGAWDGGQEASASDKTWSLTTRPPHAKILSSARSILGRDLEILGRSAMESSSEEELEEDFPGHEWITPQFSICAAYQSQTEKGIRKICSELLELKDAIENLCWNMQSKYHAFLRWHRSALTNTWCRMLASSSFRSVYAHAEVPPAHAPA